MTRPTAIDLLVAGAGPAGIAAAVTGARRGLTTLLVDPSDRIGGGLTAGLHTELCGLYAADEECRAEDTLNDGMQREMAARLHRACPDISRPIRRGRVNVLPFVPEALMRVLNALLDELPNLTLVLNERVVRVHRDADRIMGAELSTGARVDCGQVIDCTGDATLFRLAAAPIRDVDGGDDDRARLGGFTMRLRGVASVTGLLSVEVPYRLRQAVEEGALPEIARFSVFQPVPGHEGQGICKLALTPSQVHAPEQCHRFAAAVLDALKQRIPEVFAHAVILEESPVPLDRTGARIVGRMTLTEADVRTGRTFPGIPGVRNAWPMECWALPDGPQYEYCTRPEGYEIPVDCLRSTELTNAACAGRCISTSGRAVDSVRMAGMCFALGELALIALDQTAGA